MCTKDSLSHTVTTNLKEVIYGALGARQDDDICLTYLLDIVGIVEVHSGVALQHSEIRKVRYMTQQNNGYVHLAAYGIVLFSGKFHRVLLLDMYILKIRYHT